MIIKKFFLIPFLVIVLILSLFYAVTFGSIEIDLITAYKIIFNTILGKDLFSSDINNDVIWLLRLPRVILAACIGAGLSVCGVVMQAIVKNPLADPYILGISAGASLGATLSIMLGIGVSLGNNFVGISAAIGAFLVSLAVLLLANIGGRVDSIKLLLSGMALSALCSAFSSFIVYFSDNKEGIQSIAYWLMGSLAGANWEQLVIIIPVTFICVIFFTIQSRILNLMLLGDDTAVTLGTGLHSYRHIYLIVASVMIGFAVYSAGIIGFVGLIIPHAFRMVLGTDHKILLPTVALGGAIFLIWADILCRIIISGSELPIGILVSMIGAPCFIYLMVKKTYGFGGN